MWLIGYGIIELLHHIVHHNPIRKAVDIDATIYSQIGIISFANFSEQT
jgi:hypothetical protein